jgi:hypothetical protein
VALYRFLFAPVLLAVAVAAGDTREANAPAVPPAAAREAPAAVQPVPHGIVAPPASPRASARRAAPR